MDREGRNGGTLRSFEKGQSGNPAGRPRGRGTVAQIMKELGDYSDLELTTISKTDGVQRRQQFVYSVDGENTLFALMAVQLLYRALVKGDINAFKIILDRTEGRVPPARCLKPNPDPMAVVCQDENITPQQLRERLHSIRTQIVESQPILDSPRHDVEMLVSR